MKPTCGCEFSVGDVSIALRFSQLWNQATWISFDDVPFDRGGKNRRQARLLTIRLYDGPRGAVLLVVADVPCGVLGLEVPGVGAEQVARIIAAFDVRKPLRRPPVEGPHT